MKRDSRVSNRTAMMPVLRSVLHYSELAVDALCEYENHADDVSGAVVAILQMDAFGALLQLNEVFQQLNLEEVTSAKWGDFPLFDIHNLIDACSELREAENSAFIDPQTGRGRAIPLADDTPRFHYPQRHVLAMKVSKERLKRFIESNAAVELGDTQSQGRGTELPDSTRVSLSASCLQSTWLPEDIKKAQDAAIAVAVGSATLVCELRIVCSQRLKSFELSWNYLNRTVRDARDLIFPLREELIAALGVLATPLPTINGKSDSFAHGLAVTVGFDVLELFGLYRESEAGFTYHFWVKDIPAEAFDEICEKVRSYEVPDWKLLKQLIEEESLMAAEIRVAGKKERPAGHQQAATRLLNIFTNGLADERLGKAATVLEDASLTVDQKLRKIDSLMPIPPTVSAQNLGNAMDVSKAAIQKTTWYIENRKGQKDNEIGRRREQHRQRGQQYEKDQLDDE